MIHVNWSVGSIYGNNGKGKKQWWCLLMVNYGETQKWLWKKLKQISSTRQCINYWLAWCTRQVPSFVCLPFFFFFFSFLFSGLYLQHMKVPRLGIESELQLPPTPQPQQWWIRDSSVIHAIACCNARSLTYWMRPGMKPASSQTLYRVLNPLSHNGNSCLFGLFLRDTQVFALLFIQSAQVHIL